MLREFALSPEVLFASAYGVTDKDGEFVQADNHGHLALTALWKGIERGGVIRDLADGQWSGNILERNDELHVRSRELLKNLKKDGRIVKALTQKNASPTAELDWLNEALASHNGEPELAQFFGTDAFCSTLRAVDYQQLPKGVSKLPFCAPFSGGGCSIKVGRDVDAYWAALKPLAKYSRSLMFIDPYLDLSAANYRDFMKLLRAIADINPKVEIELHRQIKPAGDRAAMLTATDWHQKFRQALAADPVVNAMRIGVFIWNEFHDRFVISDLMGASVPYGFDTTAKKDETRWTLLSAQDSEDVRAEFSAGDPQKRRVLQAPR